MSTRPVAAGGGPAPAAKPRAHKGMTQWYSPILLFQTGVRVLISTIFGEFADRREIIAVANGIAAQPFDPTFDYSKKADASGDFWFDFLADTGDGWNPTYAMARLVTEPTLPVTRHSPESGKLDLPRGQILILGGDEVYPTPDRQAYEDRFLGPYEEAFEQLSPAAASEMPDLYAMPGNHDWYDGLSAFLALFCRRRIATEGTAGISRPGRTIAGRETRQTRSYFALKLPQGWWLWGTDSQIEGYLDQPQVDFFQYVASEWMDPGSKVILCCGTPSWAYTDARAPEQKFTTFSYLERLPEIAKSEKGQSMGHELKLVLTGDSHHYSRYSEDGTLHYVTAGGGGAFLHPTHQLGNRKFTWDYAAPGQNIAKPGRYPRNFKLQPKIAGTGEAVFPDKATSRSLTKKNLGFAILNPGMLLLYWAAYALFFWSLEASSVIAVNEPLGKHIGSQTSYLCALYEQVLIGFATPWPFLLFVASLGIYYYFADEPYSKPRRALIGVTHGLLQSGLVIAISCAIFWGSGRLGLANLFWSDIAPIVLGSLVAAFASATLFGCYLWLTLNLLGIHWNEGFSSFRCEDYKNFVRLRIKGDGSLEVYPVGLAKVPKGEGTPTLSPELIEGPIPVARPTKAPRKAVK